MTTQSASNLQFRGKVREAGIALTWVALILAGLAIVIPILLR
jgi:uncharacterized membrane protein YecN with MAPEG domain